MALLDGFRMSGVKAPRPDPLQEGLLPPMEQPQGLLGRVQAFRIDPRTAAGLQQAGASLMGDAGWTDMPATGGQNFAKAISGYTGGLQGFDQAQAKAAADAINAQIEQRKMAATEQTADAAMITANRDKTPAEIQLLQSLGFDLSTPQGQQMARDYLLSQKKAAGTTVNVSNGVDAGERAKKLAGADADQYAAVEQDAAKAETLINQADRLEALINDPNMVQGAGAIGAKWLGKGLSVAGIDVENSKLDPAQYEELDAIAKSLPSLLRSQGEGTMSDSDRKALESIVSTLGNSKESNLAGVNAMRQISKRKMEKADMLGQWLDEGKPLYQFNREWRKYTAAHPLFGAPSSSVADIKARHGL